MTGTVNGVSVIRTHSTETTEFTFDTIGIMLTGQTNGEPIYDYFEVITASAIPEPAHAAAFLGLGLVGVLVFFRRRK